MIGFWVSFVRPVAMNAMLCHPVFQYFSSIRADENLEMKGHCRWRRTHRRRATISPDSLWSDHRSTDESVICRCHVWGGKEVT